MTIPYCFADHALFQAESHLTIAGTDAKGTSVELTIRADKTEEIVLHTCADILPTGSFSVSAGPLPSASFDTYTLTLTDAQNTTVIHNIMMGEVFLAMGQSNLELPNKSMRCAKQMYDTLVGKHVRCYHVINHNENYPFSPETMQPGYWILPGENDKWAVVSALATKFICDLYDTLNQNGQCVPVGFLNVNWGGTPIYASVPQEEVLKEPGLSHLKDINRIPTRENWNTWENNLSQASVVYNMKIATVLGMQARAMLWYQGEDDTENDLKREAYEDWMYILQRATAQRFACDKDRFLMLSSLLYPWQYGQLGECKMGYMNCTFVKTAVNDPQKFAFCPIADLEPEWDYQHGNHPIHPTSKYEIGARMATMTARLLYGVAGQSRPATLQKAEIMGHKIRLTFTNAGNGLRIGKTPGDSLRGLYIAGKDALYLPAQAVIVNNCTLDVFCEELSSPLYVAYGMSSFENAVNLYAGDWLVAPFFTQPYNRQAKIRIEQRLWYDPRITSRHTLSGQGDNLDYFYRPVWVADPGCEVALDTAFVYREPSALHLRTNDGNDDTVFGMKTLAAPYNDLDLQHFQKLKMNLFNIQDLAISLVVEYADQIVRRPLVKVEDLEWGWGAFEVSLADLPPQRIVSMGFACRRKGERHKWVNIERLRLVPYPDTAE